ncbi:hypothetical protein AVEN_57142-1 [Araneus ventricosus]|uniref:Uncharacterized protein n=1 Tax=Araneus ventricosus TaxID=182803 RepID=A0A4Y2JWP2_ARAVE|nr:hypothetical protein AVEN_57142-1 [Araneus ventricosus]
MRIYIGKYPKNVSESFQRPKYDQKLLYLFHRLLLYQKQTGTTSESRVKLLEGNTDLSLSDRISERPSSEEGTFQTTAIWGLGIQISRYSGNFCQALDIRFLADSYFQRNGNFRCRKSEGMTSSNSPQETPGKQIIFMKFYWK